MKKSMIVLVISMFASFVANGQHSIGISSGFNLATMSHNLSSDISEYANMSFANYGTIGLRYKYALDDNWSISTGLGYARRGAETKLDKSFEILDNTIPIGVKVVHKMDYIELPVLFEYRIKDANFVSPYIFAGANLGYETNYNMLFKSHLLIDINLYHYNIDLTNNMYNRFDIAGVVGAGVYIPLGTGNLNFDIRYLHGFTDILKNTIVDLGLQHRNFRVGATYYYPLK